MTFRFAKTTLDSVLASAAVAAAAVLVTTKATAVTATDSEVVSFANSKNTKNDHFVRRKIADGPSVGFDDFQHVDKEGTELAATSTGTTRRLRNKSFDSPMDKGSDDGDASVGHNTIDIGVLDAVNTKGVRNLEIEIDELEPLNQELGPTITDGTRDEYCESVCGWDRPEIRSDSDIQYLVSFCDNNDCDCDGDGDSIDYRCPSQINCWITSIVTDMSNAFASKTSFQEPLRCWDVSRVTDMSGMFNTVFGFNQDINEWDVSSVRNMESMFYKCGDFNTPVNSWDVSEVTDMSGMFHYAYFFLHDLNEWDVSSVKNMKNMFRSMSRFNRPLNGWDVSKVTDMSRMFQSSRSFNQDINEWDVSSVKNMEFMFYRTFDFNEPLMDWDVSKVTDMSQMFKNAFNFNQDINEWDVSSVKNMESMFFGSQFFNQPLYAWDTASVQRMSKMFLSAFDFNQPIDTWNVSFVTEMDGMFAGAKSFNQAVDVWDISSVTEMERMFDGAESFNQPVDVWDISSVSNMNGTFANATMFNQCLSTWASKNSISAKNDLTKIFSKSGCPAGGDDPDLKIGPWCQESSDQCYAVTCVNDPDFRLNGVKAKDCEWVAKQKTSERCLKPGVSAACSATCSPLCATTTLDCTDDPEFKLNGLKGKNCEWVAKQKTDERCEKPGVMDSCRRTCNPSCGCRDSTDEFEIQGSTITCEDLDISKCVEEVTSSGEFSDAQLEQLDGLLQSILNTALTPIRDTLDAIENAIGDAAVEEDVVIEEVIVEPVTYADLCPNKCKKCIGS